MSIILPDLIPDSNIWNGNDGNYNKGRFGKKVSILVLHDTVGTSNSARAHFRNRKSCVSAHYIIDREGNVLLEVDEADTAYHAGISAWNGHLNINDVSIGIELERLKADIGPYPKPQYDAVVALSKEIVARYSLKPQDICRHSDCALPLGRKRDPRDFPWQQFKADVFSSSIGPTAPPSSQAPQAPIEEPKANKEKAPAQSTRELSYLGWLFGLFRGWFAG